MLPMERQALVETLRRSAPRCVDQALLRADQVVHPASAAYASHAVKAARATYDFLVENLDAGGRPVESAPAIILTQARLAASELSLDLLLRRYMAINAHIALHTTEAANQLALSDDGRVDLARTQVRVSDRLIESLVAEYLQALGGNGSTAEARLRLVKGLLAGEAFDPKALGYELDAHHLAVVAEGVEIRRLKELASELSAGLLLVRPSGSVSWAWLSTAEKLRPIRLKAAVKKSVPTRCRLAFGSSEPGEIGWRASHSQAISALSIALRTEVPTHYEETMLVASALTDNVMQSFLRRHYLNPLKRAPRGGDALLETLRAYFAADRNGSSAAAALEVSRQTVSNRLQAVEQRLGCALSSCAPEMELALRLDELDRSGLGQRTPI